MECFRIDESGYTGFDLLNPEQRFQGAAAIGISDEGAARLIKTHFPRLQATELKYRALARRPGNHPRLLALMRATFSGRFDRNIRLDQPTHLQGKGQPHAHVYGRKGDEIVAVSLDGAGSHGSKGRLHPDDADALRARGFTIRTDRIVEWWELEIPAQILLE